MDETTWTDATAQAELVRRGEATPLELVDAAIERIEVLNPALNAVIHPTFEIARAQAASGSLPVGPFRGVPMLLKDAVCHQAGVSYHFGLRALRDADYTATADTWLVERFRAAGFVVCGRTNTPELACAITTEPLAYGPTHNPWARDRSPGGSSGGSAAAVASGMVPVAHGNDMGGSIRIPASACGLVGLKPTRARTTLGPDFGELWGPVTHEHVLTRSVRDSAAILDAISGPGIGDPYTAPAPARRFADEVGADPGRLRIGFRTDQRDGLGPSHPECVAAVQAAARALETLGHEVAPAELGALDDPRGSASLAVAFGTIVAREVDRWSAALGRQLALDELEPINALLAEMGTEVTGAQWLATLEDLQLWTRGIAAWWEDNDVLMLPVLPEPPFGFGEIGPTAPDAFAALMRMTALMAFTVPFNVTGQPAISLPLHMTADGVPVGVQLVAASGREDLLLRLAAQLEQTMPWADRHPELDRVQLG